MNEDIMCNEWRVKFVVGSVVCLITMLAGLGTAVAEELEPGELMASMSTALAEQSEQGQAQFCRTISASLSASFYADGCESQVGLCTAGDLLRRSGGQVVGSTDYVADGIGGGVIGEDSIVFPPVEPPTTWSYAGILTLITDLGDLISTDVGVFDTAGGGFTELNRVQGGTGIFEGATGTFFINGESFPDGSGFDADITGEICVTSSQAAGQLRQVFLP